MITVLCLDEVVGYQPGSSCDVTMTTVRQALEGAQLADCFLSLTVSLTDLLLDGELLSF